MIPFLDVAAIHRPILPLLQEAAARVVASGQYILGAEGAAFEAELAAHLGVGHAVGVGNGLDALALTLRAAGIGPGDEVIVPGNTFVATWLAVSLVGARPVPVDPDLGTHNLDVAGLEAAIGPRTAAIVPVHLYGQPADLAKIAPIAARHGLFLLADGAQSIGARLSGAPVEKQAAATTLSFYPGKNLGALGDAGAVLTDDSALAERVRLLGNYGSRAKYHHEVAGQNSRLDELQASLLRVKLEYLPLWNARRAEIADRYSRELSGVGLPVVLPGVDPVWHLYVVTSPRRNQLVRHLVERGVQTIIHYPIPPHRQAAYAAGDFELPVTEQLARTVLSLPMGPHLSDEQVGQVIAAVNDFSQASESPRANAPGERAGAPQ
ncbi:MAG: DegT/DnrJ/EryC1/StrS family aminotransferase [Candidatus Nanopelagicales bacterium]